MKWWQRIPKKLTVLVVGGLVQLLPVDSDLKHELAKLAIGFLVGQGVADLGKSRAQIEADARPN